MGTTGGGTLMKGERIDKSDHVFLQIKPAVVSTTSVVSGPNVNLRLHSWVRQQQNFAARSIVPVLLVSTKHSVSDLHSRISRSS